ncbi:MAG: DUF4270 family protein [Bacteroidota bacterium]
MSAKKTRATVLFILPVACFVISCTRNQIDFGTVPENSYTRLVYIDTVGIQLSTVMIDSFSTANAPSFLMGKYKDPYIGLVSTKPFFQLNMPSSLPDIPDEAVFDSLTCIIRLNKYYYGDTTSVETIYVNELAQSIGLSYNNTLYNTTNVEMKPVPLGAQVVRLRPGIDDSVAIRLDNAKGQELFSKLRQKADEVTNIGSFQNYFKGMALTTGINDTSVVYGLKDTVVMRVNYHTSTPFPVTHYIDFVSEVNTEAFNQILSDRSGTGLVSSNRGVTEIPASQTHHLSFTQPGTGLYLKLIMPSLKGVLLSEDIVRLLKAELVIRPLSHSFDTYRYKLPSKVYLVQTNGSNIPGSSASQAVDPVIDNIYGQDNYYSYDVTSSVSTMINTAGSEDDGFYVVQGLAGSTLQLDRIVAGDATIPGYTTQLKLSVLIINK